MMGSVRSASHDDGLNANYYDYDVFGKPFGETSDYGYVGKPYDPVTGLSNYGYRDYSPKTARFTTVDPIRDGHNWYAYCSNDPVNFVDLWGLSASDSQAASGRSLTPEEIALHKAAGGGPVDYDKINLEERMPTVQEVRGAASSVGVDMSGFSDSLIQASIDKSAAMSLPDGNIYVPKDARDTQQKYNALVAHETGHQSQYQNGNPGKVFEQLVNEAQMDYPNPYKTPGYLEYETQQLEDRANDLYENGWTPPSTGGKNK